MFPISTDHLFEFEATPELKAICHACITVI